MMMMMMMMMIIPVLWMTSCFHIMGPMAKAYCISQKYCIYSDKILLSDKDQIFIMFCTPAAKSAIL